MSIKTPCQTPGAQFHTSISSTQISCTVDLPNPIKMSKKEAVQLEADIHNVIEIVLAKFFQA